MNPLTNYAYISRKKDNQTVKFDQLLEYNMRKVFLEKSFSKCGGETSPKPFSKKLDLWINSLKFYKVYFYCMPS